MTLNTDLTANELRAAIILVNSCLHGMGGKRPGDLEQDEYTWIYLENLTDTGYSRHEAAGLFSSLSSKGFVFIDRRDGDSLTTQAWEYLDTIWDSEEHKELINTIQAEMRK